MKRIDHTYRQTSIKITIEKRSQVRRRKIDMVHYWLSFVIISLKPSTHQEQEVLIKSKTYRKKQRKLHSAFALFSNKPTPDISE
jgi:hypothetical protein